MVVGTQAVQQGPSKAKFVVFQQLLHFIEDLLITRSKKLKLR